MTSCSNKEAELIALYTRLAQQPNSEFDWNKGKTNAKQLGYADKWLNRLPDAVWESAAAVGNPFILDRLISGESILDVGCGAGADTCVAALLVGETGKVIGIDCTPAMIDKARNNAKLAVLGNIQFHQASFTDLPIPDASIDVIISNGAINLSPHKNLVFQELFRVLKPQGRLLFADMIRVTEEASCTSEAASWANCVQGTLPVDELLAVMREAGFIQVKFAGLTKYKTSETTEGGLFMAIRP